MQDSFLSRVTNTVGITNRHLFAYKKFGCEYPEAYYKWDFMHRSVAFGYSLLAATIYEPKEKAPHTSGTVHLKSFDGDDWHTINLAERICDCSEFQETRVGCVHLDAMGVHPLKAFTARPYPTFAQALSALVKSLRIRRVDDAAYWLLYLDGFPEPQHRFRTARRLLIGAAEDGHSIAVMEKVLGQLPSISKPKMELQNLVAEAVRICKVPNWWHPSTGGPHYIHSGMVALRRLSYLQGEKSLAALTAMLERGIGERDKTSALAAVMGLSDAKVGATKQAQLILALAKSHRHPLAERLAEVHLGAKSALSGDNNFLCQAAWMMAGGVSPVADVDEPVTDEEVVELIDRAVERWKRPRPIPGWCCDGTHSAGNDVRFMGTWHHMNAVCRAFEHYGRVDPTDAWLPQFHCYDGLILQGLEGGEQCRLEKHPAGGVGIQQTTHSVAFQETAKPLFNHLRPNDVIHH
jgi:hypothetical protein